MEERPAGGWQVAHLLERVDALETKNGLLQGRLNDARDRMAQLENQNRHLRDELLSAVSGPGD